MKNKTNISALKREIERLNSIIEAKRERVSEQTTMIESYEEAGRTMRNQIEIHRNDYNRVLTENISLRKAVNGAIELIKFAAQKIEKLERI